MRNFSELLAALVDGTLTQSDEKELIELHCAHFVRRIRRLGLTYFRTQEKSEDTMRSLAHEAYVVFKSEPWGGAKSAFAHAVEKFENREAQWLYYWKGSATIDFMQRQAGSQLHELKKLRRNVRLHLRSGRFVMLDRLGGDRLWWIEGQAQVGLLFPRPDPDTLATALTSLRGPEAVRSILQAAGAALTLTEIVAVWARARRLLSDGSDDLEPVIDEDAEESVLRQDLGRQVARFWNEVLNTEDRKLLIARGHGIRDKLRPFTEVRQRMGDKSAETYRQREKQILLLIKDFFEGEPPEAVAQALNAQIQMDSGPSLRFGF